MFGCGVIQITKNPVFNGLPPQLCFRQFSKSKYAHVVVFGAFCKWLKKAPNHIRYEALKLGA